jgi:hypothetical protein
VQVNVIVKRSGVSISRGIEREGDVVDVVAGQKNPEILAGRPL